MTHFYSSRINLTKVHIVDSSRDYNFHELQSSFCSYYPPSDWPSRRQSKATMEQVNLINRINLARIVISPTFTFLAREYEGIQKATLGECCIVLRANVEFRGWFTWVAAITTNESQCQLYFRYWKIPANGTRKKNHEIARLMSR